MRMPFGLCNAVPRCQQLMDFLLAGLQWEICLSYLDDIIIYSRTFTDHLSNLRTVFERLRPGGGGGNAIYVPYGDVPPIRVYFLAFESETGCLFSSLTLKQGAKFVRSIPARVSIHSIVWHPPIGFNLFVFVQEINPIFDVFNIFIVIISHTVQEFVRVSFENSSFLCFDTLFPQAICPSPKSNWFENNRKQ